MVKTINYKPYNYKLKAIHEKANTNYKNTGNTASTITTNVLNGTACR